MGYESKNIKYKDVCIELPPPPTSVSFFGGDGKVVGTLSFGDDIMKFEGEADKSAKIFFEHYLKPIIDNYIRNKLSSKEMKQN